jgi:hypothetical protein
VRLPGLITLNLFTDPVLYIRAGDIIDGAAAAVGVSKTVGWRWFREAIPQLPLRLPTSTN